jgi:hypothetical protein
MKFGSSLNSNSNHLSFILKTSQEGRVETFGEFIFSKGKANKIFGEFIRFFQIIWIPNKFKSNSKSVLLSGFLIQIMFLI